MQQKIKFIQRISIIAYLSFNVSCLSARRGAEHASSARSELKVVNEVSTIDSTYIQGRKYSKMKLSEFCNILESELEKTTSSKWEVEISGKPYDSMIGERTFSLLVKSQISLEDLLDIITDHTLTYYTVDGTKIKFFAKHH